MVEQRLDLIKFARQIPDARKEIFNELRHIH